MRKFLSISALLIVCGCQQNVVVPTTQELVANRRLLTEWETKCNTGEYSHLSADQKTNLCSTTQNAIITVAELKTAENAKSFYDVNTKRK